LHTKADLTCGLRLLLLRLLLLLLPSGVVASDCVVGAISSPCS